MTSRTRKIIKASASAGKRRAPRREATNDHPTARVRSASEPWEGAVERMLGAAVHTAEWQNLKGKGQRLNLDPPLGTPADQAMAHKIMADNDVAPAWIEDRQRMRARIQAWRAALRDWRRRHAREEATASARWRRQCLQWQQDIQALNRAIDDANIQIPIWRLELVKLDLDAELARGSNRQGDG